MKSILITGVAGFIGSRMADWILENRPEYQIVGIDSLLTGYIENIDNRVVFFNRDLSCDNINDIFNTYDIEYVYHFAAYAAEGLSPFMRMFTDRNNMLSTDNIINNCINHRVKRLIYASSVSVYGRGDGHPFKETDQPNPMDPYGVSKFACEMNIRIAGEQHGLDWCIIRPHNVFGIKQNIWDRYRNVLGIWMWQTLNNEPMTIYGDGKQIRAFSCVDDCLEPLWNAAVRQEASREIINLGSLNGMSLNSAANVTGEIISCNRIVHVEKRHESDNTVPDGVKSMEILGFEEKTAFEDGIRGMWEWAKQQPHRERQRWSGYEIEKGIYDYWN